MCSYHYKLLNMLYCFKSEITELKYLYEKKINYFDESRFRV